VAALTELRFLVVDDMGTMRKIVSSQLKGLGITNITEADDGSTAWDLIEKTTAENAFQFIVSDWNMPKMQGVELLKRCRAHPLYKSVAFLMVTAEAEIGQVKEALTSGVDNYVVKPFTPATLSEKINMIYGKRFKA
jgi:two-component system chemotaxis response regulator CheY